MTKVVRLTRTTSGYKLPDDVMNDLRLRMYSWNHRDLAEAIGVSTSCVNAIKSGRTKWPRGTTLFRLLAVLDIELLLIDGKTGKPL
jgi:transcriptional regulator with XRE-family HTH domain